MSIAGVLLTCSPSLRRQLPSRWSDRFHPAAAVIGSDDGITDDKTCFLFKDLLGHTVGAV